ncbi:hypothetical protein AaE_005474, partial [Aphanomyces astaci]
VPLERSHDPHIQGLADSSCVRRTRPSRATRSKHKQDNRGAIDRGAQEVTKVGTPHPRFFLNAWGSTYDKENRQFGAISLNELPPRTAQIYFGAVRSNPSPFAVILFSELMPLRL